MGWADDNEKLCALETRLQSGRSLPSARLECWTARSVGRRLTYYAAGAPPPAFQAL